MKKLHQENGRGFSGRGRPAAKDYSRVPEKQEGGAEQQGPGEGGRDVSRLHVTFRHFRNTLRARLERLLRPLLSLRSDNGLIDKQRRLSYLERGLVSVVGYFWQLVRLIVAGPRARRDLLERSRHASGG